VPNVVRQWFATPTGIVGVLTSRAFACLSAKVVSAPSAFGPPYHAMIKDFVDQLSKIQAPTLVVWGDKDTLITKAEVDLLLSKSKTATFKVYPETGHGVHCERPGEFTKDFFVFAGK
jgi:pimeloyl-ACP methyl ester carboxylesterase